MHGLLRQWSASRQLATWSSTPNSSTATESRCAKKCAFSPADVAPPRRAPATPATTMHANVHAAELVQARGEARRRLPRRRTRRILIAARVPATARPPDAARAHPSLTPSPPTRCSVLAPLAAAQVHMHRLRHIPLFPSNFNPSPGLRIEGYLHDCWWPGEVIEQHFRKGYRICFDDGDMAWLVRRNVRPMLRRAPVATGHASTGRRRRRATRAQPAAGPAPTPGATRRRPPSSSTRLPTRARPAGASRSASRTTSIHTT